MMIKSFFNFLLSYLILLPVIVGSVPLRFQSFKKAALPVTVGKRYFHRNFYRPGFPAKYLTRLPFFDSSKGKSFRSYGALVGAQKRSRRDQKRTHRFYVPFFCAASTILVSKEEKNEVRAPTRLKRDELLNKILEAARGPYWLNKKRVIITDLPGTGKTYLLRDIINELDLGTTSLILWINAENKDTYRRSLCCIATAIGLEDVERKSLHELIRFIEAYLRDYLVEEKDIFVFYDNFDPMMVAAWMFGAWNSDSIFNPNMITIITTKHDYFSKGFGERVATSLTQEEIKRFLDLQKFPNASDEILKKLAKLLLGQNLATINMVASYLLQYKLNKVAYKNFLLKLSNKHKSIASTIHQLHLEKIEKNNNKLLRALGIIAYYSNPNDISHEFLLDLLDGNDTIQAMLQSGLLHDHTPPYCYWKEEDAENSLKDKKSVSNPDQSDLREQYVKMEKFYGIGEKLQKSIKQYIDPDEALINAVHFFNRAWEGYQYEDPDTWKKVKMQYDYILKLWVDVKESENKELILKMIPIMTGVATYCLDVKYKLKEAEKLLKDVLKYALRFNESKGSLDIDSELATIYLNLGKVKMEQYNISAAIGCLKNALTYDVEKIKASIYCYLAKAYLEQEKWDFYRENINEASKVGDQSEFIKARIWQIKGKYHLKKLDFSLAKECIERGLKVLGDEDHPCKLPLYYTMFDMLWERGYKDNCRDLILKMEKIAFRYFPYYHKWSFYCYYKKGLQSSCQKVNDTWKPRHYFEKAFEVGEKIWLSDHLNNVQCGLDLATVLFEAGILWIYDYEKCIKLVEKALQFAIENHNDDMEKLAKFRLKQFNLMPVRRIKLNSV